MAHTKYHINKNLFNKIDCEWKAYFLGIMYADGYVNKNGTQASLTQTEKDKEILEKLNKLLYPQGRPLLFHDPRPNLLKKKAKYITNPYFTLSITDKCIIQDLIKLGCFNRKSLTLRFPNNDILPKKFVFDFVRGYFDGDGCISIFNNGKSRTWNLAGTQDFLSQIQVFFCDLNIKSSLTPNGSIFYLKCHHIKDLKKIYRLLYHKASIFLDRKFQILNKEIKSDSSSSKHKGVYFENFTKKWRGAVGNLRTKRFNTEKEALIASNLLNRNHQSRV